MAKYDVSDITNWFNQPAGQALLQAELASLGQILPRRFGYHIIQVNSSVPVQADWMASSPIDHKICLEHAPLAGFSGFSGSSVLADEDEFPFLPNSVDVVILPHVLEFIEKPQLLLEEINDSLVGEGWLISFSFNPLSLWGLNKLLKRSQGYPWGGHFPTARHIRQWLDATDYAVHQDKCLMFRPPLNCEKHLQKLLFLEGMGQLLWPFWGAVNVFVAKKSLANVTAIHSEVYRAKRREARGYAESLRRWCERR